MQLVASMIPAVPMVGARIWFMIALMAKLATAIAAMIR